MTDNHFPMSLADSEIGPALDMRQLFTVWGIKSLSRAIAWHWRRRAYGTAIRCCLRFPSAIVWSIRYGGWDAARDDTPAQPPTPE